MIGEKLSPVLVEIEDALLEFEAYVGDQPNFTDDGFRAGIKIFMSVMMDKAFNLQSNEDMSMDTRIKMITKLGEDTRSLIKTYTDIDTHTLYEINKSDIPE